MRPIRLIEELNRHTWAITPAALQVITAVVEGETLSETDREHFHSLASEMKAELDVTLGKRVDGSSYSSVRDNIGFVMIDGPIIPRATWMSDVSGMVSLDRATNEFKALEANQRIDTIVHLFDTPGGAVTGISDYAALIRGSSKKTVSYGWMAASAGVWLAAASDHFVLSKTGTAGSIGVVFSFTDYSEADKKKGIQRRELASRQSPNKRPDMNTAEGVAVYQNEIDAVADVFVKSVATDRSVSVEKVLSDFGQGGMLVANQAVNAGLVDETANLEDFVRGLIKQKTYSIGSPNRSKEAGIMPKGTEEAQVTETVESDVAAQVLAAKTEERNRIKALDALSAKVKDATPTAREKAQALIDSAKYQNTDRTADSLAMELVDILAQANKSQVEALEASRQKTAVFAEHASKATPPAVELDEEKSAAQRRQEKLKAAKERREGRV